jgi:hypothetical protein
MINTQNETPDPTDCNAVLTGRWRVNDTGVFCGTLRIARFDFDTDPSHEFHDAVNRQMESSLNAADHFVAHGFPQVNERVTVTRKSGTQLIARLAVKSQALFRSPDNLHWLTDDDKFADVGFDPIVSWCRFLELGVETKGTP